MSLLPAPLVMMAALLTDHFLCFYIGRLVLINEVTMERVHGDTVSVWARLAHSQCLKGRGHRDAGEGSKYGWDWWTASGSLLSQLICAAQFKPAGLIRFDQSCSLPVTKLQTNGSWSLKQLQQLPWRTRHTMYLMNKKLTHKQIWSLLK